ncbi:MAG: hypothetical protein ABL857_04790, partial [Rickettsiales bacterium]
MNNNAHFYVFSDACPSDFLVDGQDEQWHTIVNFLFQSDPNLQNRINNKESHETVLLDDDLYNSFISEISKNLPNKKLEKWGGKKGGNKKYQEAFCKSFLNIQEKFKPIISACSFQEQTLINSKNTLLSAYNK